jgi:hypothetical protein
MTGVIASDGLLEGKTMNDVKSACKSHVLCLAVVASAMVIATTVVQENCKVAAANIPTPKVTSVIGTLGVGQTIAVEISGLAEWSAENNPRKLVPYLNGRALNGTYPEHVNLHENKLLFHLERTPDSDQVWADLFHEPVLRRPVTVSVGLEDQSPFNTLFDYDNRVGLIIIPKTFGILSLAVILISAGLFVFLAKTTDIIRCSGRQPAGGKKKRYDLERAQTAFWFALVLPTYVCLWLITGDLNTLTPSVLGLIGISGATTLIGNLIKRPKGQEGVYVSGELNSTIECSVVEAASAGFWPDILSDDDGYSFHRFRIVAWTILLGIIFVWSVYHYVAMPNFSGGVLAMMGISAATYLGFESLQQDVFGRIVAAGR